MEEKNLHYKGSKKFYIGHPSINTYECIGQRGRGKTTYWLHEATKRSIDNILFHNGEKPDKFYFLRRSDKDWDKVRQKGLFQSLLTVPEYKDSLKGYTAEKLWNGRILLGKATGSGKDDIAWIDVGYYGDLNNVKGVSTEDANVLIFDEIVEKLRMKYKGGDGGIHEPELLASLDETLFRNKDNWFILLGNDDSPTNPYNEYFHVPFGCDSWSDKDIGFFYETDYSKDMEEEKLKHATGRRWSKSDYSKYSNGHLALGSISDTLIADKPNYAEHVFNFMIAGVCMTAWYDEKNGVWYMHDNYKADKTKPIFAVTSGDMCINSLFVGYNTEVIVQFRFRYGQGRVRFNSQKTASLFSLMISLTQ